MVCRAIAYILSGRTEIGENLFVLPEIALAKGRDSRSKQLRSEGKNGAWRRSAPGNSM
jgi:CBS domain containing-hemolysin-like protein